MIDLHAHTTASDGQHSPTELLRLAHEAGVDTLAVTDHDTISGIGEARSAAERYGVRLIPGIELAAFVRGREAHLLGHFVDPAEPNLAGFAALLRRERERRMRRMVDRLAELGVGVPFEEVVAVSSGKNLGRPHLARVLVNRGHAADVKDAFDRWLGVGKPGYVERYRLTTAQAIALVRNAGGATTLAHARVSGLDDGDIAALKQEGLAGLEVEHTDHSAAERAELHALARTLDLVPTAGSDFHGELVAPGRRLGTTKMDREALERLEGRAGRGSGEVK